MDSIFIWKKIAIIWIPSMKKYGNGYEKNPYLSYLPNSEYFACTLARGSITYFILYLLFLKNKFVKK